MVRGTAVHLYCNWLSLDIRGFLESVVCYFIATHCSIAKLDGGRKENSVIYTLTWKLLPKYMVVRLCDSEEKKEARTPIVYAMV
jgi:transketolase